MCQHYTDNLSHRMNELAFDEMEIWQKLNKLEWDIIILQVPSAFASEISVDDNKFMEILQLISNSVQNVQRLLCIADGNYVDQNNLIDEARKLLTICNNIQQKIMNVEYLNTTRSYASNDSNDKTASSTDHRIINTSDLNSKEQ
ncbi:hypothetical protein QQG55_25945 [Brugia pahangi]